MNASQASAATPAAIIDTRPVVVAHACIVRMAEIHDHHAVFTLDSDFSVYRKHGRAPLSLIHPS